MPPKIVAPTASLEASPAPGPILPMTKGIIALLVRTFSGQKAQDIVEADTDFINQIGLKEQLSPTRANGLVSMVKQMKLYALAFQSQN